MGIYDKIVFLSFSTIVAGFVHALDPGSMHGILPPALQISMLYMFAFGGTTLSGLAPVVYGRALTSMTERLSGQTLHLQIHAIVFYHFATVVVNTGFACLWIADILILTAGASFLLHLSAIILMYLGFFLYAWSIPVFFCYLFLRPLRATILKSLANFPDASDTFRMPLEKTAKKLQILHWLFFIGFPIAGLHVLYRTCLTALLLAELPSTPSFSEPDSIADAGEVHSLHTETKWMRMTSRFSRRLKSLRYTK